MEISLGNTSSCLKLNLLSWERSSSHHSIPMFYLKFSAILFFNHFWPTLDGKYRSAAAPLVSFQLWFHATEFLIDPITWLSGVPKSQTITKSSELWLPSMQIINSNFLIKIIKLKNSLKQVGLFDSVYFKCEFEMWNFGYMHTFYVCIAFFCVSLLARVSS